MVELTEKSTAKTVALQEKEKPYNKELLKAKQDLELAWKMLDGLTIKIDKNKEK